MSREQSSLYSGEVHVWVKECKSLPLIRTTIDPYVKWYVGSKSNVLYCGTVDKLPAVILSG